jgi:hypothetical protein
MNAFMVAAMLGAGFSGDGRFLLFPKQYEVTIQLYRGDPLGSREDGTLKLLCESKLLTQSGRPVFYKWGGGIPVPTAITWRDGQPRVRTTAIYVGMCAEILPIWIGSGKVYLEAVINSRMPDAARGVETLIGTVPQFDGNEVRRTRVVQPGTPMTVRLSAASPTDQTWAVITLRECERGK